MAVRIVARVHVDRALWRRMRAQAIERGTTVEELVDQAFRSFLARSSQAPVNDDDDRSPGVDRPPPAP